MSRSPCLLFVDNTLPGVGGGGAPGEKIVQMRTWTHSRQTLHHFSRGDQRIREVIPVPAVADLEGVRVVRLNPLASGTKLFHFHGEIYEKPG